jgi:hypothetical protein
VDDRECVSKDLHDRIFENESYFVVDVFGEIRDSAPYTMEAYINSWTARARNNLSKAEIGCLLVFPFNLDEQKRGAMIIPIEVGPRSPSPTEEVTPGSSCMVEIND